MTDVGELASVASELDALRDCMLAAEAACAGEIAAAHVLHRRSAANLVHYRELRRHDVRGLQTRLSLLGLSSLGRSEPYVLATVEGVLAVLADLTGQVPPTAAALVGLQDGQGLLTRNADVLLGSPPSGRQTRIMVTMPSEAADDSSLVDALIGRGMDVARVNCAHDDGAAWRRMVAFIRSGISVDGRPCKVAMDLGGPKLRTGPLQPGPRVVKVKPRRDEQGRVVAAARVRLVGSSDSNRSVSEALAEPIIDVPVDDARWVRRRRRGDRIRVRDSRGAHRTWTVVEVSDGACIASVKDTTYVMTGLELTCRGKHHDTAVVGELVQIELAHRVQRGDRIILTRSFEPALATRAGIDHFIGCSLGEAFERARPGERVMLDDGKIGGVIASVTNDEIAMTVTDVRPGGASLRAGKGINLPDTDLQMDALTPKDVEDLVFVAGCADMVNLSFVRRPEDVAQLQRELRRLDAADLGIVLKIENTVAFENLPALLLQAMRSPQVGVMIARGDLAVEIGFERLSEVQEEIMWVCEAAHVPVIWATQVLDTLARTGYPSRAEITDAAMSASAECVMLNKGPFITDAVGMLDSILTRMHGHHDKKRSLLRRLHAWEPATREPIGPPGAPQVVAERRRKR